METSCDPCDTKKAQTCEVKVEWREGMNWEVLRGKTRKPLVPLGKEEKSGVSAHCSCCFKS